ncbi:hypothetical protein EJ08DRAFT_665562 [Tothia fuscella]|uniref:Uncharacterized protein n=1 Tax=Tothia fuscella TaxID=1048955 RepID=A0A9P4NGX2_9PEZI|nr:hypothetical protein EJ08DRAFT_665562 [Tothia fuscella]
MFSPDTQGGNRPGASVRNPRRRRRHDSEALRQQPRKRSKIDEHTFVANDDEEIFDAGAIGDGTVHGVNGQEGPSGNANAPTNGGGRHHLTIREGRARNVSGNYRPQKVDSSTVLSKTEAYVVNQLPGLPERLRNDTTGHFRASFQSCSYRHRAIVTIRDAVLIWDYNAATQSPLPRVINFPQPLKPSDPRPLASLVNTSTSRDTGLVVIYPSSGRITYWENVEAAESASLLSKRQAIEGYVKLMGGGEAVERLVNLEHAGYVLKLSSGRLAHLTLRDSQGRPAISTTQLTSDGQTKGGFLGSLYQSVIGFRNSIAAVAARPSSTKSHMEVIAVTSEGAFKIWDVSHTGANTFVSQYETDGIIRTVVDTVAQVEANSKIIFKVVDFALIPGQGNKLSTRSANGSGLNTLVLVSYEQKSITRYVLVQFTLSGGSRVSLDKFIPITVHQATLARETAGVKLLVPKPERTAFIVFSDAVVVAALNEEIENGPFQDVIHFQVEKGAELVFSDVEAPASSKAESASILLFTKSAGVVRISANSPSQDPAKQRVTAKSKIEQAIFYGTQTDNILDLSNISVFAFPAPVLEQAAVELSMEILKSASPYIPTDASSMQLHMETRAKAFVDLIKFVRQHCSSLSRGTKWQLLWDAERLEAGRALWGKHEYWQKRIPQDDEHFKQMGTLIDLAVESEPGWDDLQDPVRQWFTRELDVIPSLLGRVPRAITDRHEVKQHSLALTLHLLQEAEQIILAALETPYRIREEFASRYGLEKDELDDGVPVKGYDKLKSEPWTGRTNTLNAINAAIKTFRNICFLIADKATTAEEQAAITKLIKDHWRLIDLSCKAHVERYLWLQSRDDPIDRQRGKELQDNFETKIRYDHLIGLADFGCARDGLRIAEKAKDIKSLVALSINEIEFNTTRGALAKIDPKQQKQQKNSSKRLEQINKDVERYFQNFPDEFPQAFQAEQLRLRQFASLLEDNFGKQSQRTDFLHGKNGGRKVGKLSWINDISKEKNPLEAGKALLEVATNKESNTWAQRGQAAMAKLCLLSAQIGGMKGGPKQSAEEAEKLLEKANGQAFISKTQMRIRAFFQNDIEGALDDEAAVETLMSSFGQYGTKDRPLLNALLREGFEKLKSHQVLTDDHLIEFLTLVDTLLERNIPNSIHDQEFLLAFKVLHHSGLCNDEATVETGSTLLRLIWKRLYIRDDWNRLNNTKGMSDLDIQRMLKESVLYKTLKQGEEESLWQSAPAFTLVKPLDAMHAASEPEELTYRFDISDPKELDIATVMAKDNARDDKLLNDYISLARMNFQFEAVMKLSKMGVDEDHLEKEARESRWRDVEGGFEEKEGDGTIVFEGVGEEDGEDGEEIEEDEDENEEDGEQGEEGISEEGDYTEEDEMFQDEREILEISDEEEEDDDNDDDEEE